MWYAQSAPVRVVFFALVWFAGLVSPQVAAIRRETTPACRLGFQPRQGCFRRRCLAETVLRVASWHGHEHELPAFMCQCARQVRGRKSLGMSVQERVLSMPIVVGHCPGACRCQGPAYSWEVGL